VIIILDYIGKYTLHFQTNSDGSPSKNKDDNFLTGKYKSEIYRYSSDTIAIHLESSVSEKSLLHKFELAGIKVHSIISAETCEESVMTFNESDIHKVHKILKFATMGSNKQLEDQKAKIKKAEERLALKEQKKINKNT